MLALGAKTGYDIRQECEEKLSHFWQESYGQIYPAFARLHKKGWVHKETETGKAPMKHLYSLTDEGREVLKKWFSDPVQLSPPRNELLLKLFLGRMADHADLAEVIQRYTHEYEHHLSALVRISEATKSEATEHPDAPYRLITLDYGIRMIRTRVEWAKDAEKIIREL